MHALDGSGDDPRDEGCRMRAADKDRTQVPPAGEIAHALGHVAPGWSTKRCAFHMLAAQGEIKVVGWT